MNTIRRVQFLPENDTVYELESHKNFTKQEILDSWYTKDELGMIAIRSLNEALNDATDDDDGYLRGLEKLAKHHGRVIKANKKRCINAVMDEQDIQWTNEHDDYDRLAAVSQEASRLSVTMALRRAEEDEREARMEEQMIIKSKMSISKEPVEEDDLTSLCSDLSSFEID